MMVHGGAKSAGRIEWLALVAAFGSDGINVSATNNVGFIVSVSVSEYLSLSDHALENLSRKLYALLLYSRHIPKSQYCTNLHHYITGNQGGPPSRVCSPTVLRRPTM